MDQAKFIDLLNADLEMEYRSIVQYIQHLAVAKGAEFQAVTDAIRPHVKQELEHATTLAEQIDFLGGVPTTVVPAVPSETDTRRAFGLDLELEEQQLERYRERYEQATAAGLPDVAEALRPLLEQTQDHVRDLQSALDK
jgi:bacterioferritin